MLLLPASLKAHKPLRLYSAAYTTELLPFTPRRRVVREGSRRPAAQTTHKTRPCLCGRSCLPRSPRCNFVRHGVPVDSKRINGEAIRFSAGAVKREIEAKLAKRIPAALSPITASSPRLHPSGTPELDRLLDGGFPLGSLCEITGPDCSGRTAIALALLASASREEPVRTST